MPLHSTILYGNGPLYTGPGYDKLASLDFYRTNIDNQYVFWWTFQQPFVSPSLRGFDYQLQIDTDPNFSTPITFESRTEPATVIGAGRSISAPNAATNIAAGYTLTLNINGDGVQTIGPISLHTTGASIAADIETQVRALTAFTPSNQPAYDNFTATFYLPADQYTLTSGSNGPNSTAVVSGGTVAPLLKLGLVEGGEEIRGNTARLDFIPRRVLIVENSSGTQFTLAPTNTPLANQYVANLTTGQITFNDVNVPDSITIIYVPSYSGDIVQFQRGNVAKAFTVPVYDRIDSARLPFYSRVRVKDNLTYGAFSETLSLQTLEDVTRETADRLLGVLPDRHVYPVDEAFKALEDRASNISKIYWGYATEFDLEYLEKENTLRDIRPERTRDDRLYPVIGSKFAYPKPAAMEFVDYRVLSINSQAASLTGGTFNAVKLIGRAFTGVDPTVSPLSSTINFIIGSEIETAEDVAVPPSGLAQVTLAYAPRSVPRIPGTLLSGPVTSAADSTTIPTIPGPYTYALSNKPASVPFITGFTYSNGAPGPTQFAVDFVAGVITFNAAAAGVSVTINYLPFPIVTGDTLSINIDGDGIQLLTLGGPFASKAEIASEIQNLIRSLVAFTPANQHVYDNAQVMYRQATDRFYIVSGNRNPSPASSVLITGGTAAAKLKLLLVNGATQTFGLSYITPPAAPIAGQFRSDVDTGSGSLLTFNTSEYTNKHIVIYKKKSTVYSYVPHFTTQVSLIPLVAPYAVTLTNLSVDIPSITGFTFTTGIPAVGEFTVDFSTGVLTFNASNAGAAVSVAYTSSTPTPPTLFSRTEAGFGIKITLNNPGGFMLDLVNIAHLLRKILPAYTKFILTVN